MASQRRRARAGSLSIENDPDHHLTGPFLPQTPLGSLTPRTASPVSPALRAWTSRPVSSWLRWAVQLKPAIQLLLIPLFLYVIWPYLTHKPNPFAAFFFLSGRIPSSLEHDPRYAKSYYDLVFLVYNIVFFSLVRQLIAVRGGGRLVRYFGLRRAAKIDRFGEQAYAMRVMRQLPTYWYQTKYFWIDYPHWDMKPELKRYYLMQMAYWCSELIVLGLGLEKPRKDYKELVAHHFVTLWLVGWSYTMNMTLIGNAVYMSMDIPDAFFAFSKLLNYLQRDRAKIVAFITFFCIWSYFRHFLNFKILWSVWSELPTFLPDEAKVWDASKGVYFVWWMRYQVFVPLALLQCLNLFWYRLMCRILLRAITTSTADDTRSDDENDGEDVMQN
ncbi:hypothetical protein H0H87_008792 [Tephrocybe sp. NHM501043]|nr:hypothetical protein H0H87_008792 [Tephrocybe sp. NHM501043]